MNWVLNIPLSFSLAAVFSSAAMAQDSPVSFQRQIVPVLEQRCHACHQPANAGGQLNLGSYSHLRKGGKQGTILVPGKPDDSLIVKMISGEPPRMPMSGGPLTREEIGLIRLWISQGAADDTPTGKDIRPNTERIKASLEICNDDWSKAPFF
jgi:mono/diheme cytochrome c family protein